MRTLAEILADLCKLFLHLLLVPLRVIAWLKDATEDDGSRAIDEATLAVREAEARVEAADGPQPREPLAPLARYFLAGAMDADISWLPRSQQAWLHAAKATGVDVRHLTDGDLVAHVRGRHAERGLDPLVDGEKLGRVRRAFAHAEAERGWDGNPGLAPAYG